MLRIVPIYAAILALMYMALALSVIRLRLSERVSLGAGGNPALERQMRRHGNFGENVPFILLLLAMAEWRGAGPLWLHGLCLLLIVARLAHVAGLSPTPGRNPLRVFGMVGTFVGLVGATLLIFAT